MAFNNVPVNGWPQIKDLEKLDAIAQQIQNMPTFTSNDKAFLEDLPAYPTTDGKKALTATTSSGETSLSYEEIEDELPADPVSDGVRVLTATTTGGETVLSYEEFSGLPDYSTTEQDTGQKWIDGKNIYQKVVEFGTLPNNSKKSVNSGLTGETITKMYGIAKSGNDFSPIPSTATNTIYTVTLGYNATDHQIDISTATDMTSYSAYVVLEYTKTTV